MAQLGLQVIRQLVRAGSVIAPRLTGNLMFDRFCTPPRLPNLSEGERKATDQAKDRLRDATITDVAYNGRGFPDGTIRTFAFASARMPSRGKVLLLHGWTGRAIFMTAFVAPLTDAGFDVIACDLPGHGEASGQRLHIPLAIAALQALHATTGPWHGIIGHSFGGAIAPALIGGLVEPHPRLPIKRLVLIAAPHSMPQLFHGFGRFIGLNDQSQHWFDANVKRLTGRELATFETVDVLRTTQTPTLVLHAPNDKEVSFASAEAIAASGDHVTLKALPGLGHRRILYAPATLAASVDFMTG
ncbi:MAG: alpha/beta hydrolase [Bosea sp. (in: a-proteobacteria)]